MNKLRLYFALLSFFGVSTVYAKPLDGVVLLTGGYTKHLTDYDQGSSSSRKRFKVDFVRLSKNIALDFRGGSGIDYSDYGLSFRFFKHWFFDSSKRMGLSLGAGLLGLYSTNSSASGDEFWDVGLNPFTRFYYDLGIGLSLAADIEYQVIPYRDVDGGSDSRVRNRLLFGLGLGFSL